MIKYILNRLAIAIPTIIILIIISFVLMHSAPGGPFTSEKPLPEQVLKNINAKYGLDQPMYVQMYKYVTGIIFNFDFGPSFRYKDRSVNDLIAQGFPVTLKYGSWSFLIAVMFGVSLGVIAAVRQNSYLDYLSVGFSISAQVLPNFVMAPILVLIFTLWLGWLPGGGWEGGKIQFVIMPVIALSTSYMACIARLHLKVNTMVMTAAQVLSHHNGMGLVVFCVCPWGWLRYVQPNQARNQVVGIIGCLRI